MSFFIKAKPGKFETKKRKRNAPISVQNGKNGEITSSEDEDDVNGSNVNNGWNEESEDDNETPQEKKLRLAKIYLEEIAREERERLEDKEVNNFTISKRLKEDHLKQLGKFENVISNRLKAPTTDDITVLKCREQRNSITCLCISSDNNWVFSGSKDGVVVKWSIQPVVKKLGFIPFVKKNIDIVKGHIGGISSIAISSDNQYLVVGDSSNMIQIWNPHTLEHIGTLKGHKNAVTGLCIQQNTHTLYSSSRDRSIRVWALDEMAFVETLFGHEDIITSIDVLQSDRPVSSGGRDSSIRLWKVAEESQLVFNTSPGHVDTVKLINDNNFITGGDDGVLSVWSSLKKKPLCSVNLAHGVGENSNEPCWISAVGAVAHSDVAASGSCSGNLRLWKLENRSRSISPLFDIPVTGFINSICFTTTGSHVIVGIGKDHKFGRWNSIKSASNSICLIRLF